jgi:hypothetical protein
MPWMQLGLIITAAMMMTNMVRKGPLSPVPAAAAVVPAHRWCMARRGCLDAAGQLRGMCVDPQPKQPLCAGAHGRSCRASRAWARQGPGPPHTRWSRRAACGWARWPRRVCARGARHSGSCMVWCAACSAAHACGRRCKAQLRCYCHRSSPRRLLHCRMFQVCFGSCSTTCARVSRFDPVFVILPVRSTMLACK